MNKSYATLVDSRTGKTKAVYEIVAFAHPVTGRWFDGRNPEVYRKLPKNERAADMVMMRKNGLTYQQIGAAYGISWQAAQQAVKRAEQPKRVTLKCDICDRPGKLFDEFSVYCWSHWPVREAA